MSDLVELSKTEEWRLVVLVDASPCNTKLEKAILVASSLVSRTGKYIMGDSESQTPGVHHGIDCAFSVLGPRLGERPSRSTFTLLCEITNAAYSRLVTCRPRTRTKFGPKSSCVIKPRWAPHNVLAVDSLTKQWTKAHAEPLMRLLQQGTF
eukprot:2238685-Amphidinium_carterae.1